MKRFEIARLSSLRWKVQSGNNYFEKPATRAGFFVFTASID